MPNLLIFDRIDWISFFWRGPAHLARPPRSARRHRIVMGDVATIPLFQVGPGGRDRSTARLTLGVGLAVSAFPLSVPV